MKSDDTRDGIRLWSAQPRQQPFAETREREEERERPPEIEAPPALVIPDDRIYRPYETRSRPASLILFCAKLPSQFPAYNHLLNVSFDHHHGQTFTLFYPFMAVSITGHKLAEIVHAVNFRRCAIIREWHRDLYDPAERGIAVVERIDISSAMVSGERQAEA
jgi:hypothetical protein